MIYMIKTVTTTVPGDWQENKGSSTMSFAFPIEAKHQVRKRKPLPLDMADNQVDCIS